MEKSEITMGMPARAPDRLVVVWDMDSDEWWTLDESDYGPDGSRPPGEWQGGLFDLLPP